MSVTKRQRATKHPDELVLQDSRAQYIVRAFLAGLSMETCDYVFNCAEGLTEKIIRAWMQEHDR